jgi:hypothetical protein
MKKNAEELLVNQIIISSPNQLLEVAKSLGEFIESGLLKVISGNCQLADLFDVDLWPEDFISIDFETIPGKTRYVLSVETYHGYGGVFKKISAP